MSEPSDSSPPRRRHPRTPLALLVQYRASSLEEFLTDYCLNLSPGGLFVRTEAPHPVGTLLSLQFSLKDGSRLIEGLGRVVHVTSPEEEAAGKEAGMGIEFVELDEASQKLVAQLCQTRTRHPLP